MPVCNWGDALVATIYKIFFFAGVIYTCATFILGNILDSFDSDTDIGLENGLPSLIIFPLKPAALVAFITVFGGTGILCEYKNINHILSFVISILSGLIISNVIYRLIIVPLYKAQNTSAATYDELIGQRATVISTVFENGFGTISYTIKGNKYTSPAKHIEGLKIEKGKTVVICDIKNNVFYVIPLENHTIGSQIK